MVLLDLCKSGLYDIGVVQNLLNDFISRETCLKLRGESAVFFSMACILK